MDAHMTLDACGLEELDGAAMMAVNGGLGGWEEILYEVAKAIIVCVAESTDALIDGVKAGWTAAS